MGNGERPLIKCCLDGSLSLAVGLRCVWFGADVLDAQRGTGVTKSFEYVATAIVGFDPREGDAKAFVVVDSGLRWAAALAFLSSG